MSIYKCVLMLIFFKISISIKKQDGHVIEYANFEEYKSYLNKSYLHAHDELRSQSAFEENQAAVRQHNVLFSEGKSSFRLRTNTMADMNNESYLKNVLRLLRSKPFKNKASEIVGSSTRYEAPKSIDWRKKGFVTRPDNQKTCGSCYAFSIAESIGGQVFKRTGHILNLSTQQIVDCSTSHSNQGCIGGSLSNTLKYLQDQRGLMLATDYKYIAKEGKCQFFPELAVVNITSWAILPERDEKAIEAAVAHIGPVAVSINATPKTFQLYSDGIYNDNACSSFSVNHAMMVVGYTKSYWILKNWWGEHWGESGYMRITKGSNLCGIANFVAYALV